MKFANAEQHLLAELAQAAPDTLWLADENTQGLAAIATPTAAAVTNRWDVYQHLTSEARWFCDWDLTAALDARHYRRVVYRVSKERPVVHHLLNQLAARHPRWDQLILIGQKNEGIKSYADHAGTLFGNKHLKKHGNHYLAAVTSAPPQAPELDCQDYPTLRTTCHWQDAPLQAKPGTFGWQKVDDGSQFLIEQIPHWAAQLPQLPKRILDLGCGYGLISLAARALLPQPDIHWLATDNCAAALIAVQHNCGAWADCFAGDRGLDKLGVPLREPVDLVLCNPPFHQGFSPSGDITEKFVEAMHHWLAPGGQALVVVNQFVGLEKRALSLFRQIKVMANNGSFKVLTLSK